MPQGLRTPKYTTKELAARIRKLREDAAMVLAELQLHTKIAARRRQFREAYVADEAAEHVEKAGDELEDAFCDLTETEDYPDA